MANEKFKNLFPDFPQGDKVQQIWKDFFMVYNLLCSTTTESNQIKESSEKWLKLFLKVYQTKHVTPFMHTLVFHVLEFIKLHGSLALIHSKVWNGLTTT